MLGEFDVEKGQGAEEVTGMLAADPEDDITGMIEGVAMVDPVDDVTGAIEGVPVGSVAGSGIVDNKDSGAQNGVEDKGGLDSNEGTGIERGVVVGSGKILLHIVGGINLPGVEDGWTLCLLFAGGWE